jgi:hypothetical protein
MGSRVRHGEALELPIRFPDWLTRATEWRVLTVSPLDRDVVVALDDLPASLADSHISGQPHPGFGRPIRRPTP